MKFEGGEALRRHQGGVKMSFETCTTSRPEDEDKLRLCKVNRRLFDSRACRTKGMQAWHHKAGCSKGAQAVCRKQCRGRSSLLVGKIRSV